MICEMFHTKQKIYAHTSEVYLDTNIDDVILVGRFCPKCYRVFRESCTFNSVILNANTDQKMKILITKLDYIDGEYYIPKSHNLSISEIYAPVRQKLLDIQKMFKEVE